MDEAPREPDGGKDQSPFRTWRCPHCDHSLEYRPEHEDVAKLAITSHLTRQHGGRTEGLFPRRI